MRFAADLSHDELLWIVQAIQSELYLDDTGNGSSIWNPEKEWSGADVLQNIARTLNEFDLVPAEPSAASNSPQSNPRSQ